MSWSPQQDSALAAVKQWLNTPNSPQIFRLFGYAGSGKTTLAKEMATFAKGTVLFACFTGKASLVLRNKGCENASTIHSLIYKPIEDPFTGVTEFRLNPDSEVASAALLIIDEVSMVGEELAADLLSFGTKVLVLGDPAQLPPVKGEGFFINAKPDVMLTEVHRQAAENPIIRMSMLIREEKPLPLGAYGESRVIARSSIGKAELQGMVLQTDQLLCGLNKTRQAFNTRIRHLRNMAGAESFHLPTVGDRLVCLRNNREKGLLNGGLWNAVMVDRLGDKVEMRVQSVDDPDAAQVDVVVPAQFFSGGEETLHWRDRRKYDEFTYGYALTCHKSQGSQWNDVLVFDESRVFRGDWAKWLYTAVTRAAERVTVIV